MRKIIIVSALFASSSVLAQQPSPQDQAQPQPLPLARSQSQSQSQTPQPQEQAVLSTYKQLLSEANERIVALSAHAAGIAKQNEEVRTRLEETKKRLEEVEKRLEELKKAAKPEEEKK